MSIGFTLSLTNHIASSVRYIWAALIFGLVLFMSGISPAQAQVTQYTNTDNSSNAINNTRSCSSPLVRNFTVGASYTVSDVDIGVIASHSWRGDMQMTLQAPSGTRRQIVDGDVDSGSANNFNVRLDDDAATVVNAVNNNHSTSASPYQFTLRPNNLLSDFNGENSLGTWRLEICDLFPGSDNGAFLRADLFLTAAPANFADLSLTKTVSNSSPTSGSNITYTLSLNSASVSNQTANNVTVADALPLGVTFVSASGYGAYDPGTGIWTIPNILRNTTRTINIVVNVNATAGATIINEAEVASSNRADSDSTPGNGSTFEDDYASVSFTVAGSRTAGTPPNLSAICPPVNQITFGWAGKSWAGGSTNNSYTVAGIGSINYNITNSGVFDAGSPVISSDNTGGISGAVALYQNIQFSTKTQYSRTILALPTAVPGLQFRVFDVDFAANDFADKITVVGSYNGATVFPTLTNGVTNYVIGNVAIGDSTASDTTADGTIFVTFASPVDTVTIDYGNHTTAPNDPDGQAAAIHDITFCRPAATLNVTKISQVISDPLNGTTSPKAIPGAVMQYCILIGNAGSATVNSVSATDAIPATVTYNAASMKSGPDCSTSTTVEDDNASGADENDPYGAAVSGATLTATAATIAPAANFALTFQVTVN